MSVQEKTNHCIVRLLLTTPIIKHFTSSAPPFVWCSNKLLYSLVLELNAQCSVSKAEFKLQDFTLLQKTSLKKSFLQIQLIKFISLVIN